MCTMLLLHVIGTVVIGSALAEQTLVDLTHDIDMDAVFWPGMPNFNMTALEKGKQRGFWLEFNWFSASEHGGTHMDAPIHFSENNWQLNEIPLNRMMGPGVVIDITDRAKSDPDAQLLVSDLEDWEEKYGKIPSNAFILLNSDWDKNWPDRAKVFGSQQLMDPKTFHFPSFSIEAARWLISNRPYISAIGVDSPAFDPSNIDFPVHQLMLSKRIIGLEHIANLSKVPASGATIYAFAIKLKGGSGGPVRMFAAIGDSACVLTSSEFKLLYLVSLLAFLTPLI